MQMVTTTATAIVRNEPVNEKAALRLSEILGAYSLEEPFLPCLAEVPSGSHLALFGENPSAARMVEFWYILHGLVKAENCIYATSGDVDEVKDMMSSQGIDVPNYEKVKGLLHVLHFEDLSKDAIGLQNSVERILPARAGVAPSYPFVLSWPDHSDRVYQDKIRLKESERRVHDITLEQPFSFLNSLNKSTMCQYPVDNVASVRSDWLEVFLSVHDAAIYAPNFQDIALFGLKH